jgi:hypothetical protein
MKWGGFFQKHDFLLFEKNFGFPILNVREIRFSDGRKINVAFFRCEFLGLILL